MGNYHVPFCRAVEGATPSLTLIIRDVREALPKARLADIGIGNQCFCPWRECKTKAVWA